MALIKQPVSISFNKGMDTKSDPYQLSMDSFLLLKNIQFDTQGRLTKRNGFPKLTMLPNTQQTTLTTLNDNLIATGSSLYAYSEDIDTWSNQGTIQPVSLATISVLRSATSQTSPDMAVAASGLGCLVYTDGTDCFYQVSDTNTGHQVVSRQQLPATSKDPRVFVLGSYFIVTFKVTVTATPRLRYIAIPIANPSNPKPVAEISNVVDTIDAGYDAVVANDTLFISWGSTSTTIRTTYLNSNLIASTPVTQTGVGDNIAVTADTSASTPVIWVVYFDDVANDAYALAYNQILQQVTAPTQIISTEEVTEISGTATGGTLTVIYETYNQYTYAPNAQTDYLSKVTIDQAASVGTPEVVLRSVGLGSKAFINPDNGLSYVLAAYGEEAQPTYFLIDFDGNIYMRLAYSNGGGYADSFVLPSVTSLNGVYNVAFLFKDFLVPINKGLDNPGTEPITSLYSQTGVNLAKFSINIDGQYSSEIANALHLTGGQLWMYDGVKPVEHSFHVWPENVEVTTDTTGGDIAAGTYFYSFTYEWTDNQGNLHRSAPSTPVQITTTGSTSTNTINVPTLRLTYKVGDNPVRIVGYRWSSGIQSYYQFTSVTSPYINDTTVDSITITDTLADADIVGQTILYTTGGVVENIAAPAVLHSALFKNRLFVIYAEDPNVVGYSKQVVQNTPVEMSDLFTIYVAPTTGAQGSTGPMTCLSALDDKLIMFKRNAAYYLTGLGPDNTGASNDFTDPIFITATVGTDNPSSLAMIPQGIMFQSNKGIWLLGRDLSTTYIGAPVEAYNSIRIQSANVIPDTNQVRFELEDGKTTLMYDYFYGQWSVFTNQGAISATVQNSLHTYLNSRGEVFQQDYSSYLDGSKPVLIGFKSAWFNIAGIQGYERFYFAYLLGTYLSPFKLNVSLAYDYNSATTQQIIVTPDNFAKPWGEEQLWGSEGPWGGPGNVFEARLFPEQQKCQSFQITIDELYDASLGQAPGAGLTLSNMNLVVGQKKGYRVQKASRSFG